MVAFFVDKISAALPFNTPRISEQTLKGLAFLGPFGACLGMILFWHKVKKSQFWVIVLSCCLLHGFLAIQFLLQFYKFNMNPAGLTHDNQPLLDLVSKYINIDGMTSSSQQQQPSSSMDPLQFDAAMKDALNQDHVEL